MILEDIGIGYAIVRIWIFARFLLLYTFLLEAFTFIFCPADIRHNTEGLQKTIYVELKI